MSSTELNPIINNNEDGNKNNNKNCACEIIIIYKK